LAHFDVSLQEEQMKKVYLDLDGVLCDFESESLEFCGVLKASVPQIPGNWNTVTPMCQVIGVSEREFWENLTVEFWSQMRKTDECDMILHALEAQFQDNICILSSPANEKSAHGKILWIKEHLPKYWKSGRFCLNRDKSFLAAPDKILIDDSDKNVQKFRAAGGLGVLYPRYWNSHHAIAKSSEIGYKYFCQELSLILSMDYAQGA